MAKKKKTAKKKTAKKAKKSKAKKTGKKKRPGVYQLTLPKVGGAWTVIAPNATQATRMFRDILKVKRLPTGAMVKRTNVVTGATCRIVCE